MDITLRVIRQICLTPYLLIQALLGAIGVFGFCIWEESKNYWESEL